jgi:hypothetical protein
MSAKVNTSHNCHPNDGSGHRPGLISVKINQSNLLVTVPNLTSHIAINNHEI